MKYECVDRVPAGWQWILTTTSYLISDKAGGEKFPLTSQARHRDLTNPCSQPQ